MLIKITIILKYGIVKVRVAYSVNNDKNDSCKHLYKVIPASNKKHYDKQTKNYVLSLEQQNSKITLPASDHN
jgi:hypothetical protein